MTLKLTISDAKLTSAATAIADDVYIANTFIFNKIIYSQGEVICFHDCIASVLKGRWLAKVYYRKDMSTAYRWFYSLEDALACHGLGVPDEDKTAEWRDNEDEHHLRLDNFRNNQAQNLT